MKWTYKFTKPETTSGKFPETYLTTCGLIVCIKSGGIFKAGSIYPFYCRLGIPYIILFELDDGTVKVVQLDAYMDNTYKPVGLREEDENATFVEVNF